MTPKKIALVVGARPNFMKSAPMMKRLLQNRDSFETILIHTGQHYDHKLSQLFFEELKMPRPDIYLGVGSASHAEQTAAIMIGLEKQFIHQRPDIVVVFGDINSTMAAALVASKMGIKIAHVEAGLRSFDHRMPEEINRIVTDRLSDYLFVSEKSGLVNLKNEGVAEDRIFYTGNIMIDSLVEHLEIAGESTILNRLSVQPQNYIAMTMHRPSNVDDPETLKSLMAVIKKIGQRMMVVFPCHPRTQKRIDEFGIFENAQSNGLKMIEPLGYLDFLRLQSQSRFVLTDSGGIQEETTFLKIPCLTMRENTERPSTVEIGTNVITGVNPDTILENAFAVLDGKFKQGAIPELWDGHTAERIVAILKEKLG